MKILIRIIFCLFITGFTSNWASAQSKNSDSSFYTFADKMPEFKGGTVALEKYIKNNLIYPPLAKENNIWGTPIAIFIVEKDGSLTFLEITRRIGWGIDDEAERLVKNMPSWNPGIHNGEPVRVKYYLPIKIKLD